MHSILRTLKHKASSESPEVKGNMSSFRASILLKDWFSQMGVWLTHLIYSFDSLKRPCGCVSLDGLHSFTSINFALFYRRWTAPESCVICLSHPCSFTGCRMENLRVYASLITSDQATKIISEGIVQAIRLYKPERDGYDCRFSCLKRALKCER